MNETNAQFEGAFAPPSELVARSLDDLDIIVKFSVIHEIKRIDKIISQLFMEEMTRGLLKKERSKRY